MIFSNYFHIERIRKTLSSNIPEGELLLIGECFV